MNNKEIAAKLLKLREERMTAFIMTGQLQEELGFEGYAEALRQRWIQPDEEASGMVVVSNDLNRVAEMRELAEQYKDECKSKCDKCGKTKCSCDGECGACKGNKCVCNSKQSTREAANLAVAHATRTRMSLDEIATLGLGNTPDTPTATTPAAPAVNRVNVAGQDQPIDVGTDVNVVENGKTYTGKISQVKPDGKLQISFGADKPVNVRDYDKSEVSTAATKRL